jgi:hypothetical protein
MIGYIQPFKILLQNNFDISQIFLIFVKSN